jgi:hypothetical protein
MSEELIQQEYYCSPEAFPMGHYYGKQMETAKREGRIGEVPWRSGLEVDTWWDLGVDDSMSIWFMQPVGQMLHMIDYYEGSGFGFEHYAKILKEKPYVYGNHFMPHDAAVREQTSGEIAVSRMEFAENLGIKPIEIVKRARNIDIIIQVHIPAVRDVITRCRFDSRKCARGILALENYRCEYDEERKKLGNRPQHDWAAHGADAFRTGAVGWQPKVRRRSVGAILETMAAGGRL